MKYDYVIVGGGSAGCVLAARLSEDPTVSVCLLEAGPTDKSILIHVPAGLALMAKVNQLNWALSTVPQAGLNGRRGYQPRGKVLGGSSSVNAMVYIRGHRADYDSWAAQGNPGWSYADVLPYFKKAEHNERGADEFHGTGGPLNVMDLRSPNRFGHYFIEAAKQAGYTYNPDFNGAEQDGVGSYQVTHRNGERMSAAKAYLTPLLKPAAAGQAARPNLTVITDALATRVLLEDKRAVGVEYRRAGATEIARAEREVLVCAGALLSPQLLMLSGIGPAEHLKSIGIPVVCDSPGVGAELHDHVDVVQVYESAANTDLFGLSFGGAVNVVKGVFEWRDRRSGMLTTNFAEAGGFTRSSPELAAPDLQFHFVIAKLVDHGRSTQFGHGFSCHVCLLHPKSRGSIRLQSADPAQPPAIDPNFLAEREDMEKLIIGFRKMREIFNAPAMAPYRGAELFSADAQSDAQIEAFIRKTADTIYHPVGSCRMGPKDSDPLDSQLRVKGVQGLRVVDASMMPSVVAGNTNAPVIMIAEKIADLIRGRSLGLSQSVELSFDLDQPVLDQIGSAPASSTQPGSMPTQL